MFHHVCFVHTFSTYGVCQLGVFGIIVTHLTRIAHRLVSSKKSPPDRPHLLPAKHQQLHSGSSDLFEVISNFSHQTLERKLANQKSGQLLIPSTFTEVATGPCFNYEVSPLVQQRAHSCERVLQLVAPWVLQHWWICGQFWLCRSHVTKSYLAPFSLGGSLVSQRRRWGQRATFAIYFL